MEEVYETQADELKNWIDQDKERVAKLHERLKTNNIDERNRQKLQAELKAI